MTFLPIVERELRVRARLRSTYRFRLLAAISAIVLVGLLLLGTNQLAGSGGYGAGVFRMLSWLSFAYCLLEGARHTADCLSAEKREGTLGLLFLTDLRPYDLVLGKLMATSLNSIYGLLAIFPPLAIPLVIGGVTAGEFWRLVLVLMNTVFFSLTAGLVVSAASRDERRAWTGTAAIVLLFAVVPPLLLLNAGWSNSSLAALSPTTAFLSTFDSAYAVAPDRYWQAIWSVHLLTWTFLGMATFVLPRAWQDRPMVGRVSWWRRLAGAAGTEGKVPDLARRSRILAGNPVVWLVVRSGSEQIFLWTLVGFASVAAFTGWLLTRGAVGMALTIAGVLLLVHLALAVWVASEACHLFAAARDSGALELLLCTPLKVKEVVEGHLLGLRQRVYGPVVTLLAVEGTLLGAQVWVMGSQGMAALKCLGIVVLVGLCLIITVLDLMAVAHFGLWQGVANRKPARALTKTVLYVLVLPVALGVIWPLVGIVKNLIFVNYAREQMRRYLRSSLTERYGWAEESDYVDRPSKRALANPLPRVLPR